MSPVDSFKFLGGLRPVVAGVHPPMEVDSFRGAGRSILPMEYRIYSWKQDFVAVKQTALDELSLLGFERHGDDNKPAHSAFWTRKDGVEIWLEAGRSQSRKEAFGVRTRDARWVTVIVANVAPDNWITHVRIAFEPSDY